MLPVTFFGVLAILVKDFPLSGYQSTMTELWGPHWHDKLQLIVDATHGLFGVMLSALVSIHVYSSLFHSDAEAIPLPMVAIFGLTNFMILAVSRGSLTPHIVGHDSILIAIVIGIFTAEVLRWSLGKRWLNPLRMPYDTEAVFYHAIRLTTPFIAIWLVVAAVTFGFGLLPPIEANSLRSLIEETQRSGGGELWLSSIAVLINQVVWFLGTHGSHFIDAYAPVLFPPGSAVFDAANDWRLLFNSFVLIGGAGATIGLLLAIAIVVREGSARKVAQLSILPGIFNINETILYGLPVVLNPTYLLPFITLPLFLNMLTLACVNLGLLEFQAVNVPWTTPPIISGWMLTGSWTGATFQVLEIALSTAFYLPFVKKAEAARLREQVRKLEETTDAILSEGRKRLPVVLQNDQIGLMARGLLSDLRMDLVNNVLKLAYQPKHTLDGRVVGVEALFRWPHHRYGDLSPEMAVSLAEDSGDIHSLGRWALEQACACKARWNARGYEQITMAINVSPLQLTDHGFVPTLVGILKKHGLSPDEIELEITESLHIPNTLVVDGVLRELSELGVRLTMDDFGMGYSSLLHLRRFRVHAIKIDGSLTRDLLKNTATADIIRTIAELGRSQNIQVIAEYVETKNQRDLLSEFGCDYFQGYLYSPALYEEECLEYFSVHYQEQHDTAGSLYDSGIYK